MAVPKSRSRERQRYGAKTDTLSEAVAVVSGFLLSRLRNFSQAAFFYDRDLTPRLFCGKPCTSSMSEPSSLAGPSPPRRDIPHNYGEKPAGC